MNLVQECRERVRLLRERLAAMDVDLALLLHSTDLFYFSGTRQNGALLVPRRGDATFLVRKSITRAAAESAVPTRRFPPSNELAPLFEGVRRVGFTFDAVPVQHLRFWERPLAGRELVDLSAMLRETRSVKSAFELDVMRDGAVRLSAAFAQVPEFLRPGARELDVAAEFECRLRKVGNEGSPRMRTFNQHLFVGVAVAGPSGAEPGYFDGPVVGAGLSPASPQGASMRVVERDAPVLLDYTGVFGGYVVDMTRTFVCGALPAELARAFAVAVAIQEEVRRSLRPGATGAEIYHRAVRAADDSGLGERFMGLPGERARFVGHGVGLELDELPVLAPGFDAPLVAGQTVAVEPKFVFPGVGAVGIENTFVVASAGGERLSPLPDDLIEV